MVVIGVGVGSGGRKLRRDVRKGGSRECERRRRWSRHSDSRGGWQGFGCRSRSIARNLRAGLAVSSQEITKVEGSVPAHKTKQSGDTRRPPPTGKEAYSPPSKRVSTVHASKGPGSKICRMISSRPLFARPARLHSRLSLRCLSTYSLRLKGRSHCEGGSRRQRERLEEAPEEVSAHVWAVERSPGRRSCFARCSRFGRQHLDRSPLEISSWRRNNNPFPRADPLLHLHLCYSG